MAKSESIKNLAAALSKFQADMRPVKREAENPFFKSKYADLSGIWDAIRGPLAANGLSVVQGSRVSEYESVAVIVTTLMHVSGEWIEGELPIYSKDHSPQALGSGITYSRRYALAAILGVSTEDDDGEQAEARKPQPVKKQATADEILKQFSEGLERADTPDKLHKLGDWLNNRKNLLSADKYEAAKQAMLERAGEA